MFVMVFMFAKDILISVRENLHMESQKCLPVVYRITWPFSLTTQTYLDQDCMEYGTGILQ